MDSMHTTLAHLITSPHLWLISCTFLLAGLVKGVVGLGLPTVAIALLSLSMPTMEAASLLVLPSLFTNSWQLLQGPDLRGLLRRFGSMLTGICAGTLITGLFWHASGGAWSGIGLGLALMIYAVMGLASVQWQIKPGTEAKLSPLTGVITGAITAMTGVFVVPIVPFLQSLNLDKDHLIQAMGLAFTVSTLAMAVNLTVTANLNLAVAGHSLFAIFPAIVGMQVGQALRKNMQPDLFKRCFFIGLLGLGMHYFSGMFK